MTNSSKQPRKRINRGKSTAGQAFSSCAFALNKLREIDEVSSHKTLYQPLLEKMGFSSIIYCHGPNERGKDFICIDTNRFGSSELIVVQIKNTKLTGDSSSDNSGTGVLNQLDRCLKTKVLNPLTNLEELPRRVILFSSYPFPDYSVSGMGDELERIKRTCEIVTGEQIIELIKRHTPTIYAELVHPGEGLSAAVLEQIRPTQELAAIGAQEQRELSHFFVNIGVSSSSSILERISSGALKIVQGKRLTATRKRYQSMESLASTISRELNIDNFIYHKIDLALTRVFNQSESSEVVKPPINFDKTNLARRAPSLSEEVPFEIKNFDVLMEHLVQLREYIELNQHTEYTKFDKYVNCIRLLEQLLELLYTNKKSLDSAFQVPTPVDILATSYAHQGLSEGQIASSNLTDSTAKYNLKLSEVDPQLLVASQLSLALTGEAGAGKTSLSRIVTKVAIEQGKRCLYFPCSRIEFKTDSLKDSIESYIKTLSSYGHYNTSIDSLIWSFDLIVLDGCDEAASFRTRLADDINKLHFRGAFVIFSCPKNKSFIIPEDLEQILHSSVEKDSKLNRRLSLLEPMLEPDFDRLAQYGDNRTFLEAINQLRDQQRANTIQVILTSRTVETLQLARDFSVFEALPFNDEQLTRFLRKWLESDTQLFDTLQVFLECNAHIKAICRTPMIATLVAALAQNGYDLPKSRSDIYAKRFELLLDRWDRMRRVPSRTKINTSDKMLLLSRLALRIHSKNRTRFTENDLREIWDSGISELYPDISFNEVVWELQHSNNVIRSEPNNEYNFGHLSFQEFLTAKEIVNRQHPRFLINKFNDPWWREVLVFYAGIAGNVDRLFTMIIRTTPINRQDSLVQEMVAEARHSPPELKQFLSQDWA